MRLSAGRQLGTYQIVDFVGKGGMAHVYKAYQPALDRFVAIKVLPDFLDDDEASLERFRHEARSIAQLNHPNIVRVYDFGSTDGVTFLVLEFVEGGTLEELLDRPMPLEAVIRFLAPIASALDHAHTQDVLHRDIKPSNMLVRTDGTPMLTDFGLARMVGSNRGLTASGVVVGTPEYMSPEQVSGDPLGPAADRYSLAVVAYRMLTARVPFTSDTAVAVLMAHLTKAMPATPELHNELSAHVEEVLRRGMAKLPTDRYPTASAFVEALQPAAWPRRTPIGGTAPVKLEPLIGQDAKRQRVLVVDDNLANRELIEACLAGVDCEVSMADSGAVALELVRTNPPDLVLLDVQMPGMDGHEVCRAIKSTPEGRLLPVVMITGLGSVPERVRALQSGADDFMSKPVERTELQARVRSALRLKGVYDTLDNAKRVIYALAAAVEAKDEYTDLHLQRVADMARRLGERLGLGEPQLDDLYRGALIHDIGKIGVPDAVLLKPGPLTEDEQVVMRAHTLIGEHIVSPLHSGTSLLKVIRNHHERVDGGGYPDGLRGEDIAITARIVAVCDAHDAMISDRPYRKRRSEDEARAILRDGAGKQWDADVVGVLLNEVVWRLGKAQ